MRSIIKKKLHENIIMSEDFALYYNPSAALRSSASDVTKLGRGCPPHGDRGLRGWGFHYPVEGTY